MWPASHSGVPLLETMGRIEVLEVLESTAGGAGRRNPDTASGATSTFTITSVFIRAWATAPRRRSMPG
jgi:hypothetical protein